MEPIADELRFKRLPTEEEWAEIKAMLERQGGKVIMLDKVSWHNTITRRKGIVKDMPIWATKNCSNRPLAITRIRRREEGADKIWVFNEDYAHTNIELNSTLDATSYNGKMYSIEAKAICTPITMHHFYIKPEDQLAMLFKAQLQGQNSGSPFRTVGSVANNYNDEVLCAGGTHLKNSAPVVQLITLQPDYRLAELLEQGNIRTQVLNEIQLPQNEDEVMVKYVGEEHYTWAKKDNIDEEYLSSYYPIISYEQVQNMLDLIPTVKEDVVCCGLGSAGTGILDQIVRGNWFKRYTLIDFDRVENKNIYNQWYDKTQVSKTKTRASLENIQAINPDAVVNTYSQAFQDVSFKGMETKYLISGFDTIRCRLELLDWVEQGKIKTKYLIDCRYADLNASIYMIDTEDKEQMSYYRQGLESDAEAFKPMVHDWETFHKYMKKADVFRSRCFDFSSRITGKSPGRGLCIAMGTDIATCDSCSCKDLWKKEYEEYQEKWHRICNDVNPYKITRLDDEESSCVKQNYIDIYKFSSAFVFSAIREIEDDKPKPFTHVETTTDTLPKSMVLRK
jgi:molybdopterin/thiamine biosynthesis adenylyltransferase